MQNVYHLIDTKHIFFNLKKSAESCRFCATWNLILKKKKLFLDLNKSESLNVMKSANAVFRCEKVLAWSLSLSLSLARARFLHWMTDRKHQHQHRHYQQQQQTLQQRNYWLNIRKCSSSVLNDGKKTPLSTTKELLIKY